MTESCKVKWSWYPRSSTRTDKRPVFITGAPRCGSSWVGEVLGNCDGVRYVYEPFNCNWMPALCGQLAHFAYSHTSPSSLVDEVAKGAFLGRQSWKQLGRSAYRGYLKSATRHASNVVIKDPTASLMSTWISEQFNAQILFIMRHPCGFASSLDALGWPVGVNRFLNQSALMHDHLEPFRGVLKRVRNDRWKTLGAIWAGIHLVYSRQMESKPDWYLYKYEDICLDPVGQFTSIAQNLGLELQERSLEKIRALSATDSTDPGSTRRKSKSMPDVWRQRMSTSQIDAVMGVVGDFGLDFYQA